MGLFPQKKHKPVRHPEAKRKISVYEKTTGALGECLGKLGVNHFEEATPFFFDTVRKFFADFIPIHYKFTYEELRAEIENKHLTVELKKKISSFLSEMSDAEYHPDGIGKQHLHKFLLDFGEIVELLKEELVEIPASEQVQEKKWIFPFAKVLWDKLVHKKPVQTETEIQIIGLLAQGEHLVANNDVHAGRETYHQINTLFSDLPEGQKQVVYPKILNFYHKLIAIT